nr:hypothetical protein CFP56_33227 [Quercus suber]
MVCHVDVRPWKVFVDDVSNAMGAGAGIVIITPEGIWMEHSFRLGFKASNNEAEYEVLLVGMRVVLGLGAQEVEVYSNSRLVVNKVDGSFEAKDSRMIEYLQLVKQTISPFQKVRVIQIARGQNGHVDSLATLASSLTEEVPRLIKVEVKTEPSIDTKLDLLEEKQEAAVIRLANYQHKLAQRYNQGVKVRDFVAGDLVLHKAIGNAWDGNAGKLALNWKGLYKVTTIAGIRAYYLEDMEERSLPRPWNV